LTADGILLLNFETPISGVYFTSLAGGVIFEALCLLVLVLAFTCLSEELAGLKATSRSCLLFWKK
jgi:hypothetical protein